MGFIDFNDIGKVNIDNIEIGKIYHMSSLILEYEETTTYNYNYFIVDANNTNGVSLSSYENVNFSGDSSTYKTDLGDGTVDNSTSHTYSTAGTYIIKTKLQPGNEANKNNIKNFIKGGSENGNIYNIFFKTK